MAEPAARVGDPITHSPMMGIALAGIAVGLVVGVVIVAATIFTGGAAPAGAVAITLAVMAAISTICAMLGLGYYLGKLLGWAVSGWEMLAAETGKIISGAGTVFIGPGLPAAARYTDAVECEEPPATYVGASILGNIICPGVGAIIAVGLVALFSAHEGATVDQGSKTVLTEGKSQARVKDKTSCGGTISKGCESVLIGGPPNREVSSMAEMREGLENTMLVVEVIGTVTGLISGIGGLWKVGPSVALKLLDLGLELLEIPLFVALQVYDYLEKKADRLEREAVGMDANSEEYKKNREDHRSTKDAIDRVKTVVTVVKTIKGVTGLGGIN